jgi:hypothetical protein
VADPGKAQSGTSTPEGEVCAETIKVELPNKMTERKVASFFMGQN